MTIINKTKNEALEAIYKINEIAEKLNVDIALLSEKVELEITGKMIVAYTQSYELFWANPIAICEEAGNQAYLLFQKHVEMGASIKERQPDFVELTIPEGWEVSVNQDGTVTCTYTQPEE